MAMKILFFAWAMIALAWATVLAEPERAYDLQDGENRNSIIYTKEGDAFRATIEGVGYESQLYARLPNGWSCVLSSEDIAWGESATGEIPTNGNPVVRIPARSGDIYAFRGSYYGNQGGATGYASLVGALAASDRANMELQRYAKEYREKTLTANVSGFAGATIGLVGIVYAYAGMLYYSNHSMDGEAGLSYLTGHIIYAIGLTLGIVAANYPGSPRAAVNYYNETHRVRHHGD